MPEEDQKDTQTQEKESQEEQQPEELSASKEEQEQEELNEELPENVKDRTREQFEKLKASNAELKKQLEENKKLPSVLDYLNSPAPKVPAGVREQYSQPTAPIAPQAPQTDEEELVDEQGYINAQALQKQLRAIQEVQRQAQEAERRAREAQERIARYEQDEETKKLYQSYPELDPMSENFNKDAYDLVKNELTSQIVQTGSRDALKAAEKMSKFFRESTEKKQVQQQREQATSAGTTSHQSQTGDDFERLRLASRNDPQAVAERLRRLGI